MTTVQARASSGAVSETPLRVKDVKGLLRQRHRNSQLRRFLLFLEVRISRWAADQHTRSSPRIITVMTTETFSTSASGAIIVWRTTLTEDDTLYLEMQDRQDPSKWQCITTCKSFTESGMTMQSVREQVCASTAEVVEAYRADRR